MTIVNIIAFDVYRTFFFGMSKEFCYHSSTSLQNSWRLCGNVDEIWVCETERCKEETRKHPLHSHCAVGSLMRRQTKSHKKNNIVRTCKFISMFIPWYWPYIHGLRSCLYLNGEKYKVNSFSHFLQAALSPSPVFFFIWLSKELAIFFLYSSSQCALYCYKHTKTYTKRLQPSWRFRAFEDMCTVCMSMLYNTSTSIKGTLLSRQLKIGDELNMYMTCESARCCHNMTAKAY